MADTAAIAAAYGEPASVEREPEQLEPGAVLQQQPRAGGGVDRGGELQHHARWSGSSVSSST